ncbi:hypothetical protein ACT7DZ_06415 [Bacillus cereus]
MRKPNEIKIDTVERLLQEVINRTKLDEILEIKTLMENMLIAAWEKIVDITIGIKIFMSYSEITIYTALGKKIGFRDTLYI